MSGYTVDPTSLASNAPQYGAVADQVQAVYDTLTAKLEAEGACWGNDDAGNAFAAKYVGGAVSALQQMDTTHQGLQSMVDGICTWARNYVNADQAAQDDLSTQLGTG
jgi:uncharacterized protein YukE